MSSVIVRPIITEKSMGLAQNGSFTFQVEKQAEKQVIKKEVEDRFGVKVIKIITITVKGKKKRFGQKRTEKQMPDTKKAVVTLKKGEKIDLFDIDQKEEKK